MNRGNCFCGKVITTIPDSEKMKTHTTCHLVKGEDLNHHGTLFAGRCAEWTVESGFIAVAYELDPHNIVCLQLHGLEILHPVRAGHIIELKSRIVRTGRTTITVYIEVHDCRDDKVLVSDAFITFCYVDENTKAQPHGLTFVAENERERELNEKANELLKK
ncbi:cytosolic long-chain acyl-CoA thioester hydrolase family protein [Mucinivorans hirudinis]|uniref:Cytosolic long-chain acyl-CoA thioester hydrolase family protein n=1 Tax=Mucinivorans hirudinis TaxID=1433126 RepID=A0A060RDJ6_9BACT|nr:cytosolic long-chain acyl-CoA thioester hydrolase family protein [Mucinivorans hirudinis]